MPSNRQRLQGGCGWITHAPRSAFDGYTRQQWGRLCAELGKLRIAHREIAETTAPAKTTAP